MVEPGLGKLASILTLQGRPDRWLNLPLCLVDYLNRYVQQDMSYPLFRFDP